MPIPGMTGDQHVADVVPWNVARAHEGQSNRLLGFVADVRDNHRLDGRGGTQVGIATEFFDEAHTAVHRADSQAMRWVTDMIVANGLAPLDATSGRPATLPRVPLAPPIPPTP